MQLLRILSGRTTPAFNTVKSTQAAQLWESITGPHGSALASPHAVAFYRRLDWSHVLGWPRHRASGANYSDVLRFKLAHPARLVALRLTARQPFSLLGVDAVVATELLQVKGEHLATKCAHNLLALALLVLHHLVYACLSG